jgi:hypothetical protein
MKGVLVFLSILLFASGMAYAKEYEAKKTVEGYEVTMKIDKNPPVAGENNMTIEIKDTEGRYVSDARVAVNYSMPPMPGMPPMNYKADAELKGNKYTVKINLSMSGSWNISIKITRADKTSTAKFTVDAR